MWEKVCVQDVYLKLSMQKLYRVFSFHAFGLMTPNDQLAESNQVQVARFQIYHNDMIDHRNDVT